MLQFYEFVNGNSMFKKFEVDELLFTEYDCPIEVNPLDYKTTKNYFTFMVSGRVVWKTPGHEIEAGPGDAVFVVKGLQRVYHVSDEDFCALLIFMPDEFIEKVIIRNRINLGDGHNAESIGPVIPLGRDDILTLYATSVLNYFTQRKPPSKRLLQLRFEELIIHLVSQRGNHLLAEYFAHICRHRRSTLSEVMETHFVYNLKLEEYAKLSGRSISTFNREFRRIYGTTPSKWLKSRRLEYATFLLTTTDLNINQITLECGFKNTSHFIKTFRETFNCTPLQYRK